VAAVVVLVLGLALIRFPASLEAGIAFERGRRAERAENFALAALLPNLLVSLWA